MTQSPRHLIFSIFEGHADLESPEHGISLPNVSVHFDSQKLEFVAFLPASHSLVRRFARERRPMHWWLHNISLHSQKIKVKLKAEKFCLYRQNALSEWPESFGFFHEDYEFEDDGVRRLVLAPSMKELEFLTVESISEQHPYQVYYGGACSELTVPDPLEHELLTGPVIFSQRHPQPGFVCAFSKGNFFSLEKRIHTGLMLAHGRNLAVVMKLQDREITFYGSRTNDPVNYLPLLKAGCEPSITVLLNALLAGVVSLADEEFKHVSFALRFFLLGKTADVSLEVRFLQLMTCVEAMDGAETRQLKEQCTAALLGISGDAAALLNGMRNSLVHGRGGYQEAFEAVLDEDFGRRSIQLETELKPCISAGGELNFSHLWLRLCERLDAFWCAYLRVAPELTKHRSEHFSVALMPPICLDALETATENLQKAKEAAPNKESQIVMELRSANKRLKAKNERLEVQLVEKGKCIAALKKKSSTAV